VGAIHAVARHAEHQLGLITLPQAITAGLSRSQIDRLLASGRWIRAGRGVYRIAGSPKTWEQTALAHVLAAGSNGALSHLASAAWYAVPGFKRNRIDVTKPHGENRRSGRLWVHGSLWLPERHVATRGPMRIVTPARMLCDIAGQVRPQKLARAVDNCLSLNIVKIDEVIKTFEEWARRGRTGSAAMREVLEPRGEGYVAPASELEAQFLDFLDEVGLERPAREVALGDDEPIGRVEMVYRDKKVLVELDGRRNHTALLDREADALRDMRFTAAGWRVLRVTWAMLMTQRDYLFRSLVKLLAE
jgi:hypothetical protein